MSRRLLFHRASNGRCPVQEFLDSLPAPAAQKAAWVLRLIEALDIVPAKYFAKMPGTDDLWEVRIKSGRLIYRLLAFRSGSDTILTHGFVKKSSRTPANEIERAERIKSDYSRLIGD